MTDQAGAVVAGAQVVATADATQVQHTTVTSSSGEFAFQDLPLGIYTVTATASGFQTVRVGNVEVAAGAIYTLPVKLTVATQATTVEVSAAALALDTTTTTQTTVLNEKTVQDLPLNGRDFTQMIGLTPGFAGYVGGGYGSLNGTRANQMNWQIDGVDNNDLWHNIPAVNQGGVSGIAGIVLPIDAVAEFSAQTQAAPEAGRNPGGTVNLSLKSGTNGLHGSLYYYNRNEFFGAGSPFTPGEKQKVRNYNYGFSAGGPFVKNKLFWFATYEHQRFVIGLPGLGTEPSTAWQTATQPLLDFYQNVNPVSSVSKALLSTYWPSYALNGPASTNNYHSPDPEFGYSYNGLVKVDWNINDKNTLSARVFGGQGNQVAPVGSQLLPYYEVAPLHVFNYALLYNHVFTPSLTNQVLAGVNYFNQVFSDYTTDFNLSATGLVTNSPFPQAPNIKITGFDPIGLTPPQGRNDITGHLTNDLAWTVGKHQFKFGGEYRQAQLDEFYHRHTQGVFTFNGDAAQAGQDYNATDSAGNYTCSQGYFASGQPGHDACVARSMDSHVLALNDFLTGTSESSSISQGDPNRQVFVNTFTVFAQDSWQWTPEININYGIRYDYIGPFHNDWKNMSVFRPEIGGNGIAFQGNQIENLFNRTWTNFSPRVGFSYQVKPNTVVRGGFGLYFDSYNLNPFLDNRPGNNAPNGVEGNPAGNNPVFTVEQGTKVWTAGQSFFPSSEGNLTCLATPVPGGGDNCGVFGVFSVNKNFRPSYNYNFNFNIEQSLGSKAVFTIGYVGSQARHLLSILDINQAALSADGVDQTSRPYYNDQRIYPYGQHYGNINQIESIGTSNYNSLQATFRTNAWHGLTSQVAYTWSHSLDEVTAYRGALPQNSIATGTGCGPVSNAGFKCDYGNSDFDTRNTGIIQVTYAVPGGSRWKGLTRGWELSSLMNFHGGQPFNVLSDSDNTGTDEFTQRSNLTGNPYAGDVHHQTPNASWLNPDAFTDPVAGTFGTLRRNQFFAPGYSDVDLSVFKNTAIKERVTVQFRAEMFNLLNRANYAPPDVKANAFSLYDTIGDYNGAPGIGAGEPFNTQLALKVIF
ncbi:MAG TPA: TonB-dependent receptor [Pseudacidobacterium sp.]|nr:TonB-dependent receptor [Pseudacidobacterium sp.]